MSSFLYAYIDRQNDLTQLRLKIPPLLKEVRKIQQENTRLEYALDRLESPLYLMELSKEKRFAHLKHPYVKDIVILELGEDEELEKTDTPLELSEVEKLIQESHG